MVKHGSLSARELRRPDRQEIFKTNIHRNNGHEFDFVLLDSAEALVSFDLLTRDSYTPWGKKDEISFDARVVCKHCGQRESFVHGRRGCESGTDVERFDCDCGRASVELQFAFKSNAVLDVLDWIPFFGTAVRVGAFVASRAVRDNAAAEEHWERAAQNVVPYTIRKRHLLDEDGVVMKVAELLPGSNILAALMHASQGRKEQAVRALDLLQNWQNLGSCDGALARVAEVFPGTDVVAFAVHVGSGNFASALRAITTEREISIRAAHAGLTLELSTIRRRKACCTDIELTNLLIGPTRRFIVGALVDIVESWVGVERGDSPASDSSSSSSSSSLTDEPHGIRRHRLDRMKETGRGIINNQFAEQWTQLNEQLPSMVANALKDASTKLSEAKASTRAWWAYFMPDKLSYPSQDLAGKLFTALVGAIEELEVRHTQALQPRPLAKLETAAVLSVKFAQWVLYGSCLFLLMSFGFYRCATLLCLAIITVDLVLHLDQRLTQTMEGWVNSLNLKNAEAFDKSCKPCVPLCPTVTERPEMLGLSIATGRFGGWPLASRNVSGIELHFPRHHLDDMVEGILKYVLEEVFFPVEILGRLLTTVAKFVLLQATWLFPNILISIPVEVPEQVLSKETSKDWPFEDKALTIPAFHCLVDVTVGPRPAKGPSGLLDCRVVLPDPAVHKLLREVAEQVSDLDLRCLNEKLSGFPGPVKCSFGISLEWPTSTSMNLALTNIVSKLQLR